MFQLLGPSRIKRSENLCGQMKHMVFLKLFLRLPVVLSSRPLTILEGFCCGIHSNRMHVIRNDLICFIEEGLLCLYNGRKTDRIWNFIFQRGQSSMIVSSENIYL